MRLLVAAVVSATCALSGCASSSSPGDVGKPAPVDESDSVSLREATDIEGTTAVGQPITITYERKPEYKRVPYLAVEILPTASAPRAADVKVKGAFPGSPRVILVDEQFTILPSSVASAGASDGSWEWTTTLVTPHPGKVIAIVHDEMWSKPMSFEIHSTLAKR